MSVSRRFHISIEHIWAMLALGFISWKASATPIQLLDFWWHLKVGEIIYTTKSIPRVDLFSFTAAGKEFVCQSWLSELVYYLIYRVGGLPLLIFLHAVVMGAAFGLVFYLCWEGAQSIRIAAICTLLGGSLALCFTNARPQIFSALLFTLFYFILRRYLRRKGEGRRSLKALWSLPPLMAFWTNVHGAFLLGLILLLVFICAALAKGRPSARGVVYLSPALVTTLLAIGFNPEGYGVFLYVRTVLADPASQKLVTEWQAPNIKSPEDLPFFAVLFLGFVLFIYSSKRIDFADLVLFCLFGALGLASVRNVIWFALIMSPILAEHMPYAWEVLKASLPMPVVAFLASFRTRGGGVPLLNRFLVCTLAIITVLLLPWVRPHLPFHPSTCGLIDPRTPIGAAEFIEEKGISGRIFHPQRYGDYLIWRLYPKQKVFIDGRVHLYGKELCLDYIRILNACNWEELLEKYRIRYLLLDKGDKVEKELRRRAEASPSWRRIYEDKLSVIYERYERKEAPGG